MVSVFYIAAIITILSSMKSISCKQSMSALLYFVISLLATAVIFFIMGSYFSAALVVILFIGAVSLLFLCVSSLINLRYDNVEHQRNISPKIWLGPLILAFTLLITLIYGIVNTEYASESIISVEKDINILDMLLGAYILVIELAVLLLLCALVIAYHFIYRLYSSHDMPSPSSKNNHHEEPHDSTNA